MVLHLFVAVAMIGGSSEQTSEKTMTVLTTKLVRLGKKRDKKLLPRIVKPATPPPKSVPVKAAPVKTESAAKAVTHAAEKTPTKTAPAAETPLSLEDRLAQMTQVSSALDRLKTKSEDEPEGDPDGSIYGDVTDISKAIMGNKYASEIHDCLKVNFAVEGLGRERVAQLEASVFLRVQADGRFSDIAIEKSSGDKRYDESVIRAAHRCGKVSAPPNELAKQVRKDGIELVFRP
ncbi:TonB family protein [Myxococcota bacterium]|nr:TonB family protein [Myxococcota bacterium]